MKPKIRKASNKNTSCWTPWGSAISLYSYEIVGHVDVLVARRKLVKVPK